MSNFDSFKRVVANMMARYGGTAYITIGSAGAYDADTSEYTSTETVYRVRALIMDFTLKRDGLGSLPGTLIQEGDKQVYIEPISDGVALPKLDPTKDTIKIGNDVWKIVTLKEVNPSNNDSALIEAFVRK